MPVCRSHVGLGDHTHTWGREEPVLGPDHLRERAAKNLLRDARNVTAQQIVPEPLLPGRRRSGFGDTAVPKADK